MTYVPEQVMISSTFSRVPDKGVPEWKIFDAMSGDNVDMYPQNRLLRKYRYATGVLEDLPEDAYL